MAYSLTNCLRAGGCGVFNYPFLTQKERDVETGLDYFLARYYSSMQGRFTSIDSASPDPTNPQTFNKYHYSLNNPLRFIDPDGRQAQEVSSLTQRIRDYFARYIRRFQDQLNPEEAPQERKPGPFGDGDKVLERYDRLFGQRVEFATDLMMVADISGAGAFSRGFMRDDKTEMTIGIAGMVVAPLNEMFGVGKGALTTGRLLGGRMGGAEVAGQFSRNGDTLVAGIVGLWGKEGSGLATTTRALMDSIVGYAKEQGLSKIEVQAIAVINPKLEKFLIKQGFQKTTVVVEGEKVAAYTKTFVVQ